MAICSQAPRLRPIPRYNSLVSFGQPKRVVVPGLIALPFCGSRYGPVHLAHCSLLALTRHHRLPGCSTYLLCSARPFYTLLSLSGFDRLRGLTPRASESLNGRRVLRGGVCP
ncbi:hypothetical protein BU16DRAFT_527969 [Lophium mytilinum]|uniref:Uncharacterized protein n=1 Tax=Lophium mytilinum TaxID=390894 RepID=A0A6A6QP48_9PEZI|nr:hypothetical protein BU16DRAFT_527969 [Lophium mytilinum]